MPLTTTNFQKITIILFNKRQKNAKSICSWDLVHNETFGYPVNYETLGDLFVVCFISFSLRILSWTTR